MGVDFPEKRLSLAPENSEKTLSDAAHGKPPGDGRAVWHQATRGLVA